jgi:transposase
MPLYVGLDVHLKTCHATAMNERGEILKQEKFANEGLEIERFFKDIKDAKVAIEASYSWMPVYELLESKGYEVKLAHPKETRIIAKAKVKTDKVDSESLRIC